MGTGPCLRVPDPDTGPTALLAHGGGGPRRAQPPCGTAEAMWWSPGPPGPGPAPLLLQGRDAGGAAAAWPQAGAAGIGGCGCSACRGCSTVLVPTIGIKQIFFSSGCLLASFSQGQLQPEPHGASYPGRGVGSSLGQQGTWGLAVCRGALHSLVGLPAALCGECPPVPSPAARGWPSPPSPCCFTPMCWRDDAQRGSDHLLPYPTPPLPQRCTRSRLHLYGVEEAGGSSEEGPEEARGLLQLFPQLHQANPPRPAASASPRAV